MAIADDFTVDLVNQRIVTTQTFGVGELSGIPPIIYSMNEFYVFLQDFFDEPDRMDDPVPISAQTPTEYTLLNKWFIDDETLKSLFGGSLITSGWTFAASEGITAFRWNTGSSDAPTDADIGEVVTQAVSGETGIILDADATRRIVWLRNTSSGQFDSTNNMTSASTNFDPDDGDSVRSGDSGWANIFSLGTIEAETELYVVQEDNFWYTASPAQTKISSWWSIETNFTDPRGFGGAGVGQIDLLVKTNEVGLQIDGGRLSVYARQYSKLYDFFSIVASSTGAGRTPIPLSTGTDLNNITEYLEVAYDAFSGNDIIVGNVLVDDGTTNNRIAILRVPAGAFPTTGEIGYYLIGKNQTALVDNAVLDADGDTGTITVNFDSGDAVGGYITETTGTKTDDTTDANSAAANDMPLLPAADATSGSYFGFATPFDTIVLNVGTVGTGTYTLNWEYSQGSDTWAAITVTDGTGDFKTGPGVAQITIAEAAIPADWATDTIDSVGPIYWLRARGDAGTVTINPLGTQAWITGAKGPKLFTDIDTAFGRALRDISGDGTDEEYSCILDVNSNTLAEAYERAKYITRRGETRELDSLSGGAQIGLIGEFYTAIGDILVNYDLEAGGALVEGEAVEVEGATTNNAVLTSLHDQGATGFLILRKVKGTFANNDVIQSVATPANEVTQLNASETIVPVKPSPLGTFAGGTFFTARGVVLDNVANNEANNFQTISSDGVTVNPPQTVTVLVSNLLAQDRIAVFRLTGVGGSIDKIEYSSHTSNNTIGISTFEVDDGPISDEAPIGGTLDDAGVFRVVDDADSEEQRYRYGSFTGSIFTLAGNGASQNEGSATSTDATGVTLTDSSGQFQGTDDVQIGDQIRNITTGEISIVNSIASNNVLTNDPPLPSGWTSTDTYDINHLVRIYTDLDTAYVSFIDKVVPIGDITASSLIVYTIDIPVIVRVRRSITTKILPFATESTITSSGMSVAAIRTDDTIAS